MDQLSKNIEQFISESNINFYNNELQSAIANAEKAYSLSQYCETCSEITRKKIEFNLACLYCCSSSAEERFKSKAYLDLIQKNTLVFVRKHEIAILYTKLGDQLSWDQDDLKIDCYKSAAEHFAKSKDWVQFCNVELIHAQLLCNQNKFKESIQIANKIQTACLYLKDKQTLAKVFCDLSTIYACNVNDEHKIRNAKRLLKLALNLIKSEKSDEYYDLEMCIYQNLASVNNQLGKFQNAIDFVLKSYQLINDSDRSNFEFFILSDLKFSEGYANARLKKYDQAIQAYLDSHNYAKKTNQKNIWESLEELGQLYKLKNDYEKAYYYFDKCLKYYTFLNRKKNIDFKKTSLIEDRLKIKKKLVSKILNELNQIAIDSTKLIDTETIDKVPLTQTAAAKTTNESQTDLNNSLTNKPLLIDENLKQEETIPVNQPVENKNLSDKTESTKLNNQEMPLLNENTNENLNDDDTDAGDTVKVETSIPEMSDTQIIEAYKDFIERKDNQEEQVVQSVDAVNSNTIIDKKINETSISSRENSTSASNNTFSIYRGFKSTYKGGTKTFDSFNQGSILNHPEMSTINSSEASSTNLDSAKREENEQNSKICIIS